MSTYVFIPYIYAHVALLESAIKLLEISTSTIADRIGQVLSHEANLKQDFVYLIYSSTPETSE